MAGQFGVETAIVTLNSIGVATVKQQDLSAVKTIEILLADCL